MSPTTHKHHQASFSAHSCLTSAAALNNLIALSDSRKAAFIRSLEREWKFFVCNDTGVQGGSRTNNRTINVVNNGLFWQYSTNNGASWSSTQSSASTSFDIGRDGTYNVQIKTTDAGGVRRVSATHSITLHTVHTLSSQTEIAVSWGGFVVTATRWTSETQTVTRYTNWDASDITHTARASGKDASKRWAVG